MKNNAHRLLATGTYDKKCDFKVTTALLWISWYLLVLNLDFPTSCNDATQTKGLWMHFAFRRDTLADADKDLLDLFAAGFATEDRAAAENQGSADEDGTIENPHTAVASVVIYDAFKKTDDHIYQLSLQQLLYKFPSRGCFSCYR